MKKSIRFILAISCGFFVFSTFALFTMMAIQINEKDHFITSLADDIMPSYSNISELQSQTNFLKAQQVEAMYLTGDEAKKNNDEIESAINSLTIYKKQIDSSIDSTNPNLIKFSTAWDKLVELNEKFLLQVQKNQSSPQTAALLKDIDTEHTVIYESLKKLANENFEKGTAQAHAIIAKSNFSEKITYSVMAISLLLFALGAWWLTTYIVKHLTKTSISLQQSDSKLSLVLIDLNKSGSKLTEVSAMTSSAMNEVSASLTEITSMSQLNSKNLSDANESAQTTLVDLNFAKDKNGELIEKVREISNASTEIENIVDLIEEIAFQTNILALNAAVEAARAGEQGKGFAVVADAVRALAHKSSQSASEISKLITNSQTHINESVNIAEQSASAFDKIVTKVNVFAKSIAECSVAVQEQTQGLNQIDQSLNEFDQSIQHSSIVSDGISKSIEMLQEQSIQLSNDVAEMYMLVHGGHKSENDPIENIINNVNNDEQIRRVA